ncbi:MAG: archaetidylinositol phosphate synthase [Candidatus Bathyarchaeia archaeon]
MLTKIKKKFQSWISLEAEVAIKAGLTPNQISTLGVAFAVVSGLSYWLAGTTFRNEHWTTLMILAPIFLLISGFCDTLDGALARLHGETTVFGGFLDSLLDRYADAAIYIGIIMGRLCDIEWGVIALVGSLLVSYARARSEAAGIKMETVGIAERADRLLIMVFGSFISLIWNEALRWCMILLAILTNFTVLQRATHFYRRANPRKEELTEPSPDP